MNIESLKKLSESGFSHIFTLHFFNKIQDKNGFKSYAQDLIEQMVIQLIKNSKNLA